MHSIRICRNWTSQVLADTQYQASIMQRRFLEIHLTVKQISHSLNKTLNKFNNPLKLSGSARGPAPLGWQSFAFSQVDCTKCSQLRRILKEIHIHIFYIPHKIFCLNYSG